MDKREAEFRRAELNQELALLWAKVGDVQERLMKLTTRGRRLTGPMARNPKKNVVRSSG